MSKKPPKPKSCSVCDKPFTPSRPLQRVCGLKCALVKARAQREKAAEKLARKERREAKVRLKTRQQWLGEAQAVFNRWVRLRDHGKPCISCGTTADVQYAAGHFRSRGAASQHRFNEDNVFLQCNRNCNLAKSGNAIEMRKGMIERIGLERVEAVENDNTPHHWTIEEAKQVIETYKRKIKEIKSIYARKVREIA